MIKRSFSEMLLAILICMTVSISAFAVDIGDNKENSHVTRAEFAKYFAEMLRNKGLGDRYDDSAPFVDVGADSIYAKDVEMLYELGIINGDGNGVFRPDDYITYGEIAAMTTRLFVTDERCISQCCRRDRKCSYFKSRDCYD